MPEHQEAFDFLAKQPIGCLAIMVKDAPHTAAIHFSHTSEPFRLYFQTAQDSKKCASLLNGETVPASFTAGFSEEEWKTIQIDGLIRLIHDDEREDFETSFYAKNPGSKKYAGDHSAFLVFTPNWWRFSDFNTRPPRTIEG